MKCVLVVNRINDVLFVDCDNEFAVYLNEQGENCYQQDYNTNEVHALIIINSCLMSARIRSILNFRVRISFSVWVRFRVRVRIGFKDRVRVGMALGLALE